MSSPSTYVKVAPSPRFKETQSPASAELTDVRVRHLLPRTTQLAKERVGQLKKVFTIPADVLQHRHVHAVAATIQRLRLVKAVRNIRVQNGGGSSPSGGAASALCLPFHSCAALPSLLSSGAVPGVLTGSVDGLLTLWDAQHCTALCSQSTYAEPHGWGRVKSIAVYPRAVRTEMESGGGMAETVSVAFTASMFQREVRVWRIGASSNSSTDTVSKDKEEDEPSETSVSAAPSNFSLKALPTAPTTARASGDVPGHDAPAATTTRGGFEQLAVDPTGAMLASTHSNSAVHVWDVRRVMEGTAATSLTHLYTQDGYETAGATLGVAFHPDGSLLTTTDAGGRVCAWDTRSGRLAFHTGGRVGSHLSAALCVSWSPCGVRLASGGADGVVHLYDARKLTKAGLAAHHNGASGSAPFQMLGHDDAVTSLRFYANTVSAEKSVWHPNDAAMRAVLPLGLVTTSLDHTMRLWDADTGLCVRTLDAGMPLYAQCRPATAPLSSRYVGATSVMAVGHGKSWLLYDVGLRGEVEEEEVDGKEETARAVEVTENDVVVSVQDGPSGGMRFSRFTAPTSTTAVATAGEAPETSDSSDREEEDEMMALMRQKPAAAAPTAPAEASDEEASSEDEMEMLKKK